MNSSLLDLRTYIGVAISAARAAAKVLREDRIEIRDERQSSGRDIKLRADLEAESVILKQLSQNTKFPIISEESSGDANRAACLGSCWIVDPLDGTYNFARHIPLCCISIGLWDGDRPLLGVVYDICNDIMYEGIVGIGVCRNGVNVSVAEPKVSNQALLFTGLPVAGDFSPEAMARFSLRMRNFKKVRMLGSAAFSLSLVACGSGDVYFEEGIRIWDVAAGVALVVAAGGSCDVVYCDKGKTVCNVSAGSSVGSLGALSLI